MIDPIPAITSGKAGPRKFEEAHWRMAKEKPDTNTAGNTSFVFLMQQI